LSLVKIHQKVLKKRKADSFVYPHGHRPERSLVRRTHGLSQSCTALSARFEVAPYQVFSGHWPYFCQAQAAGLGIEK
ncbi:MAG: hypothetical protein ACK5N9_27445, partial [Pirellula sp.]